MRYLGAGGMGVVYEAHREELGRRFAVKFVHPALASSERALRRFRREALAAASIENQHVVAVSDFGTADDGAPFIVMEYLEGQPLSKILANRRLSAQDACDVVYQAAIGVAAAHEKGLIHRDLKPANLFVCASPDGRRLVKVLDFGIATDMRTEVDGGTLTLSNPGTPHYMSPEQARGEKRLDPRSDVYALGLILYECLSGHRAHKGNEYNEILYRILHLRLPPIQSVCRGLGPELCRVVDRAVALDTAQRFRDASALAKALRSAAGGPSYDTASAATGSSSDELASTFSYPPERDRRGLGMRGAHWARWSAVAAWLLSAGFVTPVAPSGSRTPELAAQPASLKPAPAASLPPPVSSVAAPPEAPPGPTPVPSARSKPRSSVERRPSVAADEPGQPTSRPTQEASQPLITTQQGAPELPATTAVRIARENPYLQAPATAASAASSFAP